MLFAWMASSFNYYLVNIAMKYGLGDIFVNTFVSMASEIPVTLLSGVLVHKFGLKKTLFSMFTVAVAGAVGLLVLPIDQVSLVPIFILLGKSGVSGTFNICYLANAQIFPAIFAGTAFGICNIGAKLATILAPLIAETSQPIPGITFAATATLAAFLSLLIAVDTNPPKEEKKVEE
jgi:nitrate/nitrite transporter NarK